VVLQVRDYDSTEQHWDHCWLNVNNEDWWIGAIEFEWSTGKRWLRLWRDEKEDQTGLMSIDMARVPWDEYNRLALDMLLEQWGPQWPGKTRTNTVKTAPPKSITTKRLPKRSLDG